MVRRTAVERRELVLEAAIQEFAAQGYHAASTTAIARRAGISQPYIYALFPSKRELFLAAHQAVAERIRARLIAAAANEPGPEERLRAMGEAYLDLIGDRADVLCQLQAWAAAGDPDLRGPVRDEFLRMFEAIEEAAGAARDESAFFLAGALLLAIAAALDVPQSYWAGVAPGTDR